MRMWPAYVHHTSAYEDIKWKQQNMKLVQSWRTQVTWLQRPIQWTAWCDGFMEIRKNIGASVRSINIVIVSARYFHFFTPFICIFSLSIYTYFSWNFFSERSSFHKTYYYIISMNAFTTFCFCGCLSFLLFLTRIYQRNQSKIVRWPETCRVMNDFICASETRQNQWTQTKEIEKKKNKTWIEIGAVADHSKVVQWK